MRPPQLLSFIGCTSSCAASLIFVLLSLGPVSVSTTAADVAFSVAEETPRQASIGNLLKSLGGGGGGPFRIVPPSTYFTVDNDGHVRVSRPIDREDPAACLGAPPCVVEFNAFRGADRVLVRITVEDINDNAPVFKDAQKVLPIEEGDTRFSHPLDQATDADIGDNGMARKGNYFLSDNGGGAFALDTSTPGFLSLILNPDRPPNIDYEQQKQYNLTLTACDGGRDPRCGYQRIIVQVKDRNDNAPNVTAVRVQDVPETLNIGGLVATIEAHDRDSGLNGQLDFAILDPDIASLLDVDRTGKVTLRRSLNAKIRSSYEVGVLVSDGGSPSKRTLAKFSFRVIDVNDHSPVITVIPMMENSDRIVISENVAPAFLALVVVTDDDLGENGRVECELAGSPAEKRFFRMDGSDKGGYTLQLVAAVDYEERRRISVRVDCRDFGQPVRNASRTVPVFIRGVNEFEPQFAVTNYFTSMEETYGSSGNNIGNSVFNLMATDRDRGDSLTFELQDPAAMAMFEVRTEASLFDEGLAATVGQAQLRVRSTVDRDSMDPDARDYLRLVVVLRDSQVDNGTQHSASVTLTISVIDVNDNPPRVQPPFVFRLRENCPLETRALSWPSGSDRLTHRDPDQGINADVFYRLLSVVGRRPPAMDYLDAVVASKSLLDPEVTFSDPEKWPLSLSQDGVITSRSHLDRETFESFTLTVMAYNRAAPQPLNSTALITVELLDENDNDPEWVFPSATNFVVNYTSTGDLGEITRVEARDRDLLSNVTYSIVSLSDGVFSLDRVTGRLTPLRQPLPGRYVLQLRASDNGPINRVATTQLVINAVRLPGFGIGQLRDAQANLAIIVAMVIATAVISVVLVLAIVCVRRRGRANDFDISPAGDLLMATGPGCRQGGSSSGGGCGIGCDKEISGVGGLGGGGGGCCQCDEAAAESAAFGRLCGGPANGAHHHQFALTTFNQVGSACELRPQMMELRNEVVINQQDLDGDSADSGRGGSEDDHAGHLYGAAGRQGLQLHHSFQHHYGSLQQPGPMAMAMALTSSPAAGGTLPRRVMTPQLQHQQPQQPHQQQQHMLPLPQMSSKSTSRHHQYLGIPEEEGVLDHSSIGFLPPPLPPHGVELRTVGRLHSPAPAFGQPQALPLLPPPPQHQPPPHSYATLPIRQSPLPSMGSPRRRQSEDEDENSRPIC